MSGEIDLYGVFVSPLLIWVAIALPLTALLRRLLAWAGLYNLVWHRPLFDLAVLITILGGVGCLFGFSPTSSLWPWQ